MDFCSPGFWLAIKENFTATILFTLFVYIVQRLRYVYFLRCRYHNREFDVFDKEDSQNPVRRVVCEVSGNIIKYKGEHILPHPSGNQGKFEGEFIMNPINLRVGSGLHVHEGYDGFNFPKIIIKNRSTFYIESHYLSKKEYDQDGALKPKRKEHFEIYYQAYVWKIKKLIRSGYNYKQWVYRN